MSSSWQQQPQQQPARGSWASSGAPGGPAAAPQQAAPPSSRRMTYGAVSSAQREARERNELLTGAGARSGSGGAAGAAGYAPPGQQQAYQAPHMNRDELSTEQLMEQAVEQHRDTTATARRALQIVEQTKEIQGSTQAALHGQREQMHRIEGDLDKIGEDLSYSERILRFMKMCCCFGFCCSCITEPSRSTRDKNWRPSGSSSSQPYPPSGAASNGKQAAHAQRQATAAGVAAQRGSAAYPGVSTRGLGDAGFGEQAAVIDNETQQQNQYLDEISKGLDQLKFGAQRMNEELRYQEAHADRIRQDADALEYKLHSVNREGFRRI